jgi:hypothetical protein
MKARSIVASAILAIAAGAAGEAIACASDYTFEPVSSEIELGDAVVAVRLVHKPSGKPVTDAVVFQARINMAPDGMPTMDSILTPLPGSEPGVYAFKTEIEMTGRWLLSISAKVQGEMETVVGRVIFKATP